MEALDYLYHFNMLSSESDYNRIAFLDCLYKDFTGYCDFVRSNSHYKDISYPKWNAIVSNYYQKFMAIGRLRKMLRPDNEGLTKELWGYFYINYIIPERDKLYPKISAKIKAYRRKKFPHLQDKINNYENR